MKKTLYIMLAVMVMLFAGCAEKKQSEEANTAQNTAENTDNTENTEKVIVKLYFPDENAVLKEETREVEAREKEIYEAVAQELIKGPEKEGLVSVIPEGTKLNGIKTESGICTVDLSGEFIEKRQGGTATDTLCVYSMVNSLAELDGIDKVQFLIDGEKVEIFGDFLFDEPFEPNESLISK